MKAKQVNEFEQGQDPYDAMKIGKNHKGNHTFSMGDKIELLDDIWMVDARQIRRDSDTDDSIRKWTVDDELLIPGRRIGNMVSKLFKKGEILEYDGEGYDEDEEEDMGEFWGDFNIDATWILKNKSIYKKL
jgi:hypothetical protein